MTQKRALILTMLLVLTMLLGYGLFMTNTDLAQNALMPASHGQSPNLPDNPAAAPYDEKIKRLSYIAGALTHLSPLCGGSEDEHWFGALQNVLEAETASQNVRYTNFMITYNRSLEDYRYAYHRCTAHAGVLINRFLYEGESLVREILVQYGGG